MKVFALLLISVSACFAVPREDFYLACEGRLIRTSLDVTVRSAQDSLSIQVFADPRRPLFFEALVFQSSGSLLVPLAATPIEVPSGQAVLRSFDIPLPFAGSPHPLDLLVILSAERRNLASIYVSRLAFGQWEDALLSIRRSGIPLFISSEASVLQAFLRDNALPFQSEVGPRPGARALLLSCLEPSVILQSLDGSRRSAKISAPPPDLSATAGQFRFLQLLAATTHDLASSP